MNSRLTVKNKSMNYYQLLDNEIRKYADFIENGTRYKP